MLPDSGSEEIPKVTASGALGGNTLKLGEGNSATYGVYYEGDRVGEYIYKGESDSKLSISGNITVQGTKVNLDGYMKLGQNGLLSEIRIDMSFKGSSGYMSIKPNYAQNSVNTDISLAGQHKTTEMKFQSKKPMKSLPLKNLETGYSETFQMTSQGQTYNLERKVIKKETVKVPYGSFEAYAVETTAPNTSTTRWLTSDGGLVKFSWSFLGRSFTAKLEEI